MQVAELIRAAKAGDRQAFEELVRHFRPQLRGFADRLLRGRVRRRVDASDIVQDLFGDAWHHFRDQFQGESEAALRAWMFTILRRNIALTYRRQYRAKCDVGRETTWDAIAEGAAPHSSKNGPSRELREGERRARLEQILETLPAYQRLALELRYFEQLSYEEIAALLDRSLAAVTGYLKRGMKELRDQLGDDESAWLSD